MITKAISFVSVLAFAVLLGSTQAGAATMTFKNLPAGDQPFLTSYVEHGITMTPSGGDLGSFFYPEAQHLDDSGTPFASTVTFTMDRRFNARKFDVLALSNAYCSDASQDFCGDPYDNVKVEGVRDGSVVAVDTFYMGDDGTTTTHLFDAAFSDLDALLITALRPDLAAIGGSCGVFAPCAHFSIDNVRLKPIPAPAALPLLAAALAALGFAGRRRRPFTA